MKGLTALTVASLVETGQLGWATTLRSLLGDRLPLVDPAVTIEQLLGHASGVGDYIDEDTIDDIDDHILAIPAHRLETPADYLPLIDGLPQASPPGERFAYNNSGYVMLSIAVEAVTGQRFHDLVRERVLEPAGMVDTAFLRSDDLPERAAIGYLHNGRSNVFHLPVRGAGDGGAYTTGEDVEAFWMALFAGRIVPAEVVEKLVAPRSDAPRQKMRYGLGFWLRPDRPTAMLEGMDAGSGRRHKRATGSTILVQGHLNPARPGR